MSIFSLAWLAPLTLASSYAFASTNPAVAVHLLAVLHRRSATVMCPSLSDAQLAQFLCRDTLMQTPGWNEGNPVTVNELQLMIDEWDDDEAEEFELAIEALAACGWLRLDHVDDDDLLFAAASRV